VSRHRKIGGEDMIDTLIAAGSIVALVLAPLAWRARYDRLTTRAMLIRADVDAALRHALGGESLVSVGVVPATAWRRGRVVLSTPAGYGWLIEQSWDGTTAAVPANYDLVIRGTAHATSAALTTPTPLKAAA
jgi:hypothetical protein